MGPFIQRPKVVIEFGLKSENVQKGSQRRRGVVDPRENEKALKIASKVGIVDPMPW